jgi:hypothetical protein
MISSVEREMNEVEGHCVTGHQVRKKDGLIFLDLVWN